MPPDSPRHRASWPIRIFRLGDEPDDDLAAVTTVAERVEMVWILRDRMWELTGRARPSYARSEIPVHVIRR